jgi:cytochrome c-type biogenesis protein CcmE
VKARLGLVAGAGVVAAAFAWLVYGGIGDNLVYYLTPTELAARVGPPAEGPVRLGGDVRPGSVVWDAEALDLRFELTDSAGGVVPVRSRGAPPQMFRDGMGIVVEGRMNAAGFFESSNLMVMHGNEYRAPEEGAAPAPHLERRPSR